MKVVLSPADLKPQYQKIDDKGGVDQKVLTGDLTLDHFQDDVQDVVRAVGRAEFETWNGNNRKVIDVPKADRSGKVYP